MLVPVLAGMRAAVQEEWGGLETHLHLEIPMRV
jgi:hypothetical protein